MLGYTIFIMISVKKLKEGMLTLGTCKCVSLVPNSIANSIKLHFFFQIMYGARKSVNEKFMGNAHCILLVWIFTKRVPLHAEHKRDVIWPEML